MSWSAKAEPFSAFHQGRSRKEASQGAKERYGGGLPEPDPFDEAFYAAARKRFERELDVYGVTEERCRELRCSAQTR